VATQGKIQPKGGVMTTVNTSPLTDLAEWIDTGVISITILNKLEEEAIPTTLENGKKVWLDALEELHHLIAASIVGLITRGELQ